MKLSYFIDISSYLKVLFILCKMKINIILLTLKEFFSHICQKKILKK